jgi:hypothetical protein
VRRAALLVALAATSASTGAAPGDLDITAFFTGRTHTDNVLKIALHRPTPLIVDSVGGKGDRGDFVLVDTVHEGDKPVRTRKWIMHPVGPNHFAGTLTDAVGPVDMIVSGDSATIRYKMKGGLDIIQTMTMQGDGRSLSNHVVAKKFGLTFAHVDGTLRKLD